ncbi:MAG TPA: hypothetical protein VHX15_04280 [Frankiaceae bacterium]|jgi:hypothetical protein|nr:hypothetical protein [Frankiaceae bacterium]
MMLTTETPPSVADDAPAMLEPTARSARCNVSGTSTLWSGPQANPRRIRLTTPGNPVHR